MQQTVFTVGHSTHRADHFVDLLLQHGITALCDVRSKPYSRINPQFNREALKETLRASGIAYVFLGRELGARSENPSCCENGKVQYERLAQTELFRQGVQRIRQGMENYRLALMCAEKEPLECHRTILVARHLAAVGIDIQHIHANGKLESHPEALNRLARLLHLEHGDIFRSQEDVLADAYRRQGERIAYDSRPGAVAPASVLERAAG